MMDSLHGCIDASWQADVCQEALLLMCHLSSPFSQKNPFCSSQFTDRTLVKCICTKDDCVGETQACADAASERVQALEAELHAQSAEAETAAAAAAAELEAAQVGAAATLITVRAELKAALAAAETELASTKVPLLLYV